MKEKHCVLYDSECLLCRFVARVINLCSKIIKKQIGVYSIHSEENLRFLEKQFGGKEEVPFSVYFVDERKIYWGQNAISALAKYFKLPVFLQRLFCISYPLLKTVADVTKKYSASPCKCKESGEKELEVF